MRIQYWVTRATKAHSKYVTLIAFPLQQCLYESASLLRYTYITYLVNVKLLSACMSLGFEGLLSNLNFLQRH